MFGMNCFNSKKIRRKQTFDEYEKIIENSHQTLSLSTLSSIPFDLADSTFSDMKITLSYELFDVLKFHALDFIQINLHDSKNKML